MFKIEGSFNRKSFFFQAAQLFEYILTIYVISSLVTDLLYSFLVMKMFCNKNISFKIHTLCTLYFVPLPPDDDLLARNMYIRTDTAFYL